MPEVQYTQNTKDLKLVFLHVPKTAGTTIHQIITKWFEKNEICPERFRGLDKYATEDLDKFRLFSGHFTRSQIERIPGKKFIFTCLRNPQDRIISLYYFWRRHSEEFAKQRNLRGPLLARSCRNLKDFLLRNTPIPRNAIQNEICRVLAGTILVDAAGRYFENSRSGRVYVSETDLVFRAIKSVVNLDFILFTDTLKEDINWLCGVFSKNNIDFIPNSNNRFEYRPHLEPVKMEIIDDEHRNLLHKLTALDEIIYSFARIKRNEIIQCTKNFT